MTIREKLIDIIAARPDILDVALRLVSAELHETELPETGGQISPGEPTALQKGFPGGYLLCYDRGLFHPQKH